MITLFLAIRGSYSESLRCRNFDLRGTVLSDTLQAKVILDVLRKAGVTGPDQQLPAPVRVKHGTNRAGGIIHYYMNYSSDPQTFSVSVQSRRRYSHEYRDCSRAIAHVEALGPGDTRRKVSCNLRDRKVMAINLCHCGSSSRSLNRMRDTRPAKRSSLLGRWHLFFSMCLLLSPPFCRAEPTLPNLIGDHMVLQQGREIHIWGKADPGEKIVVSLVGTSRTTITTPGAAGACGCLQCMPADHSAWRLLAKRPSLLRTS